MKLSSFSECGDHGQKLSEIERSILEQKTKNGEKVTEFDVQNLENDLLTAYKNLRDTINEIARKSRENGIVLDTGIILSDAINNMERIVTSGTTTRIQDVASVSMRNAINKSISGDLNRMDNISENNIPKDMIQNGAAENIKDKLTGKDVKALFTPELNNNLDSISEKAKQGDKTAQIDVTLYKAVLKFMADNPELNEKSTRGALAWMGRLAASGTKEAQELLVEMAKKYNLDVLTTDQKGKPVFEQQKFEELYKEKIGEVKTSAEYDSEMFKGINEKVAEERYNPEEDRDTIKKDVIDKSKRAYIIKALREGSDNMEEILKEAAISAPDVLREILEARIKSCEKMQEKGASAAKIQKQQEAIMLISKAMSSQQQEREANTAVEPEVYTPDTNQEIEL